MAYGIKSKTQEEIDRLSKNPLSQDTLNYQKRLSETENEKPGEFSSQYTDLKNRYLDEYLNREKFSYNPNTDALYRQYADAYERNGERAMRDTVAQASALTGGFGNSYAQTAGWQMYQSYMDALNDKIPELYAQRYGEYQDEGNAMLNRYSLTQAEENADYEKYRYKVGDWKDALGYYSGRYDSSVNRDTTTNQMGLGAAQNTASTENADYWNEVQLAENQRQFNENLTENQRQYNESRQSLNAQGTEYKSLTDNDRKSIANTIKSGNFNLNENFGKYQDYDPDEYADAVTNACYDLGVTRSIYDEYVELQNINRKSGIFNRTYERALANFYYKYSNEIYFACAALYQIEQAA